MSPPTTGEKRKPSPSPDLPFSFAWAKEVQERLASLVILEDRLGEVRLLAGVDAGFSGNRIRAAAVLLSWPGMQVLFEAIVEEEGHVPYVPGFLAFREAPAIERALAGLPERPHLLFCDGQGMAHPRGAGIACHIGVDMDLPAIGVAKSLLCGSHVPLGPERGASSPLVFQGKAVGMALRTRKGVKPVYVSVGHKVSLGTAVAWVLATAPRYRLPEPIRAAHRLASHKPLT